MRGALFVLVACVPRLALACSGPGAMERIVRAERTGRLALVVTLAVLALAAGWLCVRARRVRKSAVALLALVLLHPAVWFGARHGDCGSLLELTAWPATLAAGVIAGAAVALAAYRARREAARWQV